MTGKLFLQNAWSNFCLRFYNFVTKNKERRIKKINNLCDKIPKITVCCRFIFNRNAFFSKKKSQKWYNYTNHTWPKAPKIHKLSGHIKFKNKPNKKNTKTKKRWRRKHKKLKKVEECRIKDKSWKQNTNKHYRYDHQYIIDLRSKNKLPNVLNFCVFLFFFFVYVLLSFLFWNLLQNVWNFIIIWEDSPC